MIPENLLNQAARWGFVCEVNEGGRTVIHSDNSRDRWSLELIGDRWTLRINDVAQISFQPLEALQFLERQWLKTNSRSGQSERPFFSNPIDNKQPKHKENPETESE